MTKTKRPWYNSSNYLTPEFEWASFEKRNDLEELINIPTEERSMIQISFRTQDPNIKTGTTRVPRQNLQLIHDSLYFQDSLIRSRYRKNPGFARFLARPSTSKKRPIQTPPSSSSFSYVLSLFLPGLLDGTLSFLTTVENLWEVSSTHLHWHSGYRQLAVFQLLSRKRKPVLFAQFLDSCRFLMKYSRSNVCDYKQNLQPWELVKTLHRCYVKSNIYNCALYCAENLHKSGNRTTT